MIKSWDKVPVYYKCLDVSALLQEAAIDDVVMEEAGRATLSQEKSEHQEGVNNDDEEDEDLPEVIKVSLSFEIKFYGIDMLRSNWLNPLSVNVVHTRHDADVACSASYRQIHQKCPTKAQSSEIAFGKLEIT